MGQPGGKGGTLQRDRHCKGGTPGEEQRAGMLSWAYGKQGTAQQDWEGEGGGRQSWLLQLDISNVKAAHILVGTLESPGDVLIHRAVIKVQALQGTERGDISTLTASAPAPSPPQGGTQCRHHPPCTKARCIQCLPHTDFRLHSHLACPPQTFHFATASTEGDEV